jgi:hypothetical protein
MKGATVKYTTAQKLSPLAKYAFDKVNFMYIYSELFIYKMTMMMIMMMMTMTTITIHKEA